MKFRFPIVIIDEDYRSENTSGLGIRALAQAIESEGFEVLGVTSYGDLSQFAQQQSRASAFILSIDDEEFTSSPDLDPAVLNLRNFIAEVRQSGRIGAGASLFHRPELGCTQCHGINAATLGIGPDLGALGTAQTPEFIVGAILEPQREVKEGFASVSLRLREGDELTGRIAGEDDEHLVIHDTLTRRDVRVRKDRIADRHDIGSVMPPGLSISSMPWLSS